ncbi:hypothetical protein, partial [Xanthobacter versatilis]|uniref:hypothetical protein n=1 Tax=Xanthobacter autotrophicus (strain ATCC BAA-1158 / Py2) TaxID=78245 RepID=UPI00372A266D
MLVVRTHAEIRKRSVAPAMGLKRAVRALAVGALAVGAIALSGLPGMGVTPAVAQQTAVANADPEFNTLFQQSLK